MALSWVSKDVMDVNDVRTGYKSSRYWKSLVDLHVPRPLNSLPLGSTPLP